jgi:hypothetical protein
MAAVEYTGNADAARRLLAHHAASALRQHGIDAVQSQPGVARLSC